MRLQVSNIKNSRIPVALGGLCSDDPRILQYLNEAEELMLNQGRWWGSIKRAQFCVNDGCIVMPREVDTVEQIAICNTPIPIYTNWYAFTQNLASVQACSGCTSCSNSVQTLYPCGHIYAETHGTAVSWATTKGSNKVIRFYPADSSDVGKKVIVQGYDSDNIWVRTSIGGVVRDGEEVTLALPFVQTVTEWYPGSPTGIIKDLTNYNVRMYSYDTAAELLVQLADYQPNEEIPEYRRLYIKDFNSLGCCNCTTTSEKTVTAIVKLAHVELVNDWDYLLFENLNAYKAAMMAVKAQEEGDFVRFAYYFYGNQASPSNNRGSLRVVNRGGAIPLLAAELRSKTSDRVDAYVHRENNNRFAMLMADFR